MYEKYNPDASEQLRLVIATAVIGTVVALYALPVTSTDLWSVTRGFMLGPGIFAFIFLIMTGAHLKYKRPGTIGDLDVAHSIRKFFYNWMIDLFWAGFFITVVFFTAALAGWDGKHVTASYMFGLIFGGVACLIVLTLGLIFSFRENRK